MSADPRRVTDAYVLPQVSYAEAAEMAFFGAKVIHPKTMHPAAQHNIPLVIRNTFEPQHPGTLIMETSEKTIRRPEVVCGFSTVDGLALMNVEGTGMMGVPGVTHRVFGVIARIGVSVPLIAQASSEQSISFAVPEDHSVAVREVLLKEFRDEISTGLISGVSVTSPVSIVAAVGDGMSHFYGLAGHFFSALGKSRVNVLAIAQGPTERNVSAVVQQSKSAMALQAVHAAFLSKWPIDVALIANDHGIAALREEIALLPESHLEFRIKGSLSPTATVSEVDVFINTLASSSDIGPHRLVIDMSTDPEKALLHKNWLADGWHVITSNIFACGHPESSSLWKELKDAHMPMYSHNVALSHGVVPILSTLETLQCSGDVITRIEGLFSPLVTFVTSRMEQGISRQDAIIECASHFGVTEVEVEADVSGQCGGMKMLACAREMGYMDLTLGGLTISPFPATLPEKTQKTCWRYIGRLTNAQGTLGLEEVALDHPLAQVHSGIAVRIFTRRMAEEPMLLQGPISKRSIAEGVLAQALKLRYLLDGVWNPKHTIRKHSKVPQNAI